MKSPYIKEAFGEIVKAASDRLQQAIPAYPAVNYIYDTVKFIDQRLVNMANDTMGGASKYPLVALIQPFIERRGGIQGLAGEISPTFLLAYWTEQNLTSPQRDEQIFIPYLYPLYEAFMLETDRSRHFLTAGVTNIQHEKTDFPFYGGQNQDKSTFTDKLDIIQVKFTNLKTYLTC